MIRSSEVDEFVQAALECSIFAAPLNPGLTHEEVIEATRRAGYDEGETRDAVSHADRTYVDGISNMLPAATVMTMWRIFSPPEEPDFRNVEAFDFLWSEFGANLRSMGAARAGLDRAGFVERGVVAGLPHHDIEVAVTAMTLAGQLVEKDGVLKLSPTLQLPPLLPSAQRRQRFMRVGQGDARRRAMPIVKDIVERRSDGRPQHAESLDAFAEALERLGYRSFRSWWVQIVGELRRGDSSQASVSIAVLSASLVEGALTFVVRHAQSIDSPTLASKDFTGDPRTWKIDDLVNSAAAGREAAILLPALRARTDSLIKARQRIHAGRMLSEFPRGIPDLRPEEARGARQTAEDVVRAVLDWLDRYPPSAQ